MTTFKTLIRKSDGQWMKPNLQGLQEIDYPEIHPMSRTLDGIKTRIEDISQIDWSLYELIEVAVIRLDKLPSRKNVLLIASQIRAEEQSFIAGHDYLKSQILEP